MRKIEEEMIEAIQKAKSYRKDNTEVQVLEDNGIWITLHRNLIAVVDFDKLRLYDAGYQTKTTKSRLNTILSYYDLGIIYQKNYQWYLKTDNGDEEWTGSKVFDITKGE
jgi:hypothetical protein